MIGLKTKIKKRRIKIPFGYKKIKNMFLMKPSPFVYSDRIYSKYIHQIPYPAAKYKAKCSFIALNNSKFMPMIGLGTFKSPRSHVTQAVKYAIDIGYRHIDCAYVYQNEREIGLAIYEKMREGKILRDDIFITSKLWNTFHAPSLVANALQASLQNLGLDYLDLYLIHWPMAFKEGTDLFPKDRYGNLRYSDVDYIETWAALETLVRRGLVKSIGVANFNKQQLMRLLQSATIKPVTNQIECHPYLAQSKLIQFCHEMNIVVSAYSPLGTPSWGKFGQPTLVNDPLVTQIARKMGKTPEQVLIRYQIDRGNVCLWKSMNPWRMESNFDVFDFKLYPEDIEKLNKLDRRGKCRFFAVPECSTHKDHPFVDEDY